MAGVLFKRGRNSPPIASRGGEPFSNFTTIETPFYAQQDARWKDEEVGGSHEKLADVGCTVCSLAMALGHFGVRLTPKELNDSIKRHDGYTWRGWLKWETVVKVSGGKVDVEILAKPSHADIDAALKRGQPVLAKVFIHQVIPHWVLIVGKDNTEYLIRDPLGDDATLEALSKIDSDVYGVRIIKLASP